MDMRVLKPFGHPMPETAAFVARMKSAFGEQEIDEAICRGKAGEPTFYVSENGRSVGTAAAPATDAWRVDRSVRDRHYCDGCDGSCIGTARSCRP